MKEYSKKEASLLQEKQVAKLVNGQVQVASGGTSHGLEWISCGGK